ncbi:MAG: MurR/RpiR family transcriptional regulator [Ruminococcus sp.]|nr:MurR/RpiR family transcriptional regulator [Ruminococcus sp.]
MEKNLLKTLKDNMSSCSKGHRLITEYVINHSDKAAFMTASKLGRAVGVSESTVVRFAISLGFKGYPEFQKSLQEQVKANLTAVQRMELSDDRIGGENVLENVMTADIDRIKETLSEISTDDFNQAVEAIANANSIYIIGNRSASALASFAEYYLSLMFSYVKRVKPSSTSEMLEQVMKIDERDVIIGFSFPRYSTQTRIALQYARDKKAKVVAFTDSDNSPLVPFADYLLVSGSDMASFVDSLVAPLSLLNALIVAVSAKKKDMVSKNFATLEAIWEEYNAYDTREQ